MPCQRAHGWRAKNANLTLGTNQDQLDAQRKWAKQSGLLAEPPCSAANYAQLQPASSNNCDMPRRVDIDLAKMDVYNLPNGLYRITATSSGRGKPVTPGSLKSSGQLGVSEMDVSRGQ